MEELINELDIFVNEKAILSAQIKDIENKRNELAKERNTKKAQNKIKNDEEVWSEVNCLGKQISDLGNQSQWFQNQINSKLLNVREQSFVEIDNLIAESVRKSRIISEQIEENRDNLEPEEIYELTESINEIGQEMARIMFAKRLIKHNQIIDVINLFSATETEESQEQDEQIDEILESQKIENTNENEQVQLINEELKPIEEIAIDPVLTDYYNNINEITKNLEKEIITLEETEENQLVNTNTEEPTTIKNIVVKVENGELIYKAELSNETTIKNSLLTKFYKLADRKYLIIDKEIKSADNLLSTTDFLLVELDKAGNATLTNHKVNLKTFSETQIITSNYTFDIATEILTYGSDKIDLKKIIGSSNNYTKEDLIPDESKNINDNVTNIGTNGNNGNNTTGGNDGNNTGGNGNTTGGNGGTTIEEIKKATKQTSVVSVTSTVNKIIIDYVIYDPYKEYTSVYMEVQKEDSDKVEVIYLNANNTRYELKDILPNTKYNLKFKYTATEEGQTIIKEFSNTTISTQKPKLSLKVTRTRVGEITYVITTDNSYKLTKADLVVTIKDSKTGETRKKTISDVSIDSKEKIVKLDKMTDGDIIELKLINVKSEDTIIKGITASDKFIY